MEWQRRPPGGLLPGDPPRARSASRSAPTTGCRGRPNPHRRGRGAWTASSTCWGSGSRTGRGLLLGPCVRRSGQQGRARGVLIVCCDGPAGLPEAARGDLARLHGPHLRGPPRSAPPVRFVAHKGPQGGRRRRAPEPAPPPTRRPPDGPQGPSASPTRAASTRRRRRRGRGPGRGTPPSWPSPRPCAGSPLHHQRDRVAEPPSRAVRREPRPLPLRRGGGQTAVAGGSATPEGPPGRPARQR